MKKKVMLAPNEQLEFDDHRIGYPMLASPKLDGVRGVCVGGEFYSRTMKPFGNRNIPEAFGELSEIARNGSFVFDFEIYDSLAENHGQMMSVIAAHDAPVPGSMRPCVFDMLTAGEWAGNVECPPFAFRVNRLAGVLASLGLDIVQIACGGPGMASVLFDSFVTHGHEGMMLRSPDSVYKHGRATVNEGSIFKFKKFQTDDGLIVGVVQRRKLKEGVSRTRTPTGGLERVHEKDAYELDEMVGAFLVRFEDGTESEVNYGKGFDHDTRRKHWRDRNSLIGKCVEVRHLPHGAKTGKRIGTLVRFRPDKEGK